jgi:hypothetical protein
VGDTERMSQPPLGGRPQAAKTVDYGVERLHGYRR